MRAGTADQILPHSLDYERSIIANLLIYPESAAVVFEKLEPDDFYRSSHRIIVKTAKVLYEKGEPCDLSATVFALKECGLLEKAGGLAFISTLPDNHPVPSNVESYCEKIAELSTRRRLVAAGNDIMRNASTSVNGIESILAFSQMALEKAENSHYPGIKSRRLRVPPVSALFISNDEWNGAELTPKCIVEDYLYADVAVTVAPGGTGKTTITIYEAIHIVLGQRLYGLDVVNSGWTLFVTSEDSRERLIARLRETATAMQLTAEELSKVRKGVLFWDVSGDDMKLIALDDGNIRLTPIIDDIVSTYKDDPPVSITFDPIISFGIGESKVNDNEQGLVGAARKLRNGLNCAVRIIHHTGKANARDATLDQYTSRGGSALPDGSRMTTVLQSWTSKNQLLKPPEGCHPSPGSSITILARAKLSYSKPNLPLIWIKRTGWSFEHFTEIIVSDEERDRAKLNQVEQYIRSAEARGVYHNKTSLKASYKDMGFARDVVVDSVERLMAQGRVIEKDLPKDKQVTKKKTYLSVSPDSADFKKAVNLKGENRAKKTPEIKTAAYRENLRRIHSAEDFSESLKPAAESSPDSAGFAGLDEYEQDSDPWEVEI